MSFSKILIFVITFLWSLSVSSQNKEEGIIIFEDQQNVFELYFIKTSHRSLISYLETMDTVIAVSLGAPGDDANNTDDFKRYLNETIKFDTSSVVINQRNHLEQEYEGPSMILSSFGFIKYHKSKSYKLAKSYKKLYINNKFVIVVVEGFVPIDSFTSIATKAK